MIAIIAGNYKDAKKWSESQFLSIDEWFYANTDEVMIRKNFNVVVLESASELPPHFFEKLFTLAKYRGRMK